jgi:hypothetical protein
MKFEDANDQITPDKFQANVKAENMNRELDDDENDNNNLINKFNLQKYKESVDNTDEPSSPQKVKDKHQSLLTSPNNPKGTVVKTSENNVLGGNLAFSFANPISKTSNKAFEISQLVSLMFISKKLIFNFLLG